MTQKADPSPGGSSQGPGTQGICGGVDVGATLAKLVTRRGDDSLQLRIVPSHAIERAAREVEKLRPARLGLTGAGAPQLNRLLSLDTAVVNEFDAWRDGSRELLARQGEPAGERDLLVAIGTGTSALLVQPEGVTRVGGTALGGGTLLGLGSLLLGTDDFDEIIALAGQGDRSRVDLMVSDIYPDGDFPLPSDMNASSFAKVVLGRPGQPAREPADMAHALVCLVGEPIAMICGALASVTGAERIVLGGSTLRSNPVLREILAKLGAMGRPVLFLEDGEYAGAVGALLHAARERGRS